MTWHNIKCEGSEKQKQKKQCEGANIQFQQTEKEWKDIYFGPQPK